MTDISLLARAFPLVVLVLVLVALMRGDIVPKRRLESSKWWDTRVDLTFADASGAVTYFPSSMWAQPRQKLVPIRPLHDGNERAVSGVVGGTGAGTAVANRNIPRRLELVATDQLSAGTGRFRE